MESWMENPKNIKILAISIVIAIIVVPIVVFFATHGYVTIESEEAATVSLTSTANASQIASSKQRISQFISTGTYIASATDSLSVHKKTVEVRPFSAINTRLTLPKVPRVNAVTNQSLASLSPSSTPFFIDSSSGHLARIGAEGGVEPLSPIVFRSIKWINGTDGFGVGTTDNTTLRIYSVKNGAISEIALPRNPPYTSTLPYTVASDGTLYMAFDGSLYRKKPSSIGIEGIGETPRISAMVSASSTSIVAVVSKPTDSNPFASELIYMSTDGKITHTTETSLPENPDTQLYAEWNNDESKLLVVASGKIDIYSKEFQHIESLPETMSTSPHWRDNNTIVYLSRNIISLYDLASKESSAIATLPTYVTGQQLTPNTNDDYFVTGRSSVGVQLYRAGGKENTTAEILSESNMQQLSASCDITFTNFTKLIINYRTYQGEENMCEETIRSYLSSIRLGDTSIPLVALAPKAQ